MNDLLRTAGGGGLINGLLGGDAGGVLVSALTSRKGRKYAGKALTIGGVAALGGLSYKAYQQYQRGRSDRPQIPRSDFDVTGASSSGYRGMLLVRSMISAAMAVGHVNDRERAEMLERMTQLGLTPSERAALDYEFQHPASTIQLAAAVNDIPTAVAVYLASLVAIDPDCMAGKRHLSQLATLLGLPQALIGTLNAAVESRERTAA